MWDEMIPPSKGEIHINRLGTVCMSYETFQLLGYEIEDDHENFAKWKDGWESREC